MMISQILMTVMQHQPAYVVRIWELRNDYVIGAEDIYSFVGHVVTSIFLSLFTGLLFTKCHILVCNNARHVKAFKGIINLIWQSDFQTTAKLKSIYLY